MGKRRAHEASKELGIEFKDLQAAAEMAGIEVKNVMMALDDEDMDKIRGALEGKKQVKVVEKRVGQSVIRRRRKKVAKPAEELMEEPETEEQAEDEPEEESVEEAADTADARPETAEEPQAEPVEAQAEAPAEAEEAKPEPERTETAQTEESAAGEAPEQAAEEAPEEAKSAPVESEVEGVAEEAKTEEEAAEADEQDDDEEEEKPKRKIKKIKPPKQISKIVKHIDLEEIQPAQPPRPQQRRGGPGGGRPGPRSGGGGRLPQAGPMEIVQPVMESQTRRRSKDKPSDYVADDEARYSGRGKRRRQVIDDSYFDRRGRGKRKREKVRPQRPLQTTPKAIKRVIKIATDTILVGELAKRMGIKANELILKLMQLGLQANINQAIDLDTATILANEFGYDIESAAFEEEQYLGSAETDPEEDLRPRPPIVTVMGHVDHGKTSILDYIRQTRVAAGEAGGITQHIGAYVVRKDSGNITFLDTPGHEAFTSMRARGAQVTDLVVLVVAADDGVMPQTVEAINHSKAAQVPIIVAVNKIDKPDANPARVRNDLMQQGMVPEELGGDIIMVNVSAKTGEGIDTLLEMISLQSEVLELRANPKRENAEAVVVEGKLDRGRGAVATILVRHGTLHVGDFFVCGAQSSKIKAMIDDTGKRVKSAGPSEPVEILGFDEVPDSGDAFNTLKDEKRAKEIAQNRYLKKREMELAKSSRVSLEELVARVKAGEKQTLSLVIKGDVQGTVEALKDSLVKETSEEVKIDIIHTGVGGINESDVLFASASNAIIVGFNVRAEAKAQSLAEQEGVEINTYSVIYDVIEDIRNAVLGLMAPQIREEVLGHVEVRDVFVIPKVGAVAGSYVTDGKAVRGAQVRLVRDNIVIYTGKLASLRRFKDDVAEVAAGYECGIGIEGYNDIKIGDRMEFFREVEISARQIAAEKK